MYFQYITLLCSILETTEPGLSIDNGRVFHVLWRTIVWPLDVSRELFLDGQSFSRHTVSGALAVLWP